MYLNVKYAPSLNIVKTETEITVSTFLTDGCYDAWMKYQMASLFEALRTSWIWCSLVWRHWCSNTNALLLASRNKHHKMFHVIITVVIIIWATQ